MHGSAGTLRRRRIILAEFMLGALGGVAVGVALLASGASGWGIIAAGVWALGVGLNYLPLALHAISLSRPGALDAELAGVEIPSALRHYTTRQLWVFVPALFVVLSALRFVGRL